MEGATIADPEPMVNGAFLRQYLGKKVRTVVKVLSMGGEIIQAELCDKAQVSIRPAPGSAYTTSYVEVVGIAERENLIRELSIVNFGEKFGKTIYRVWI